MPNTLGTSLGSIPFPGTTIYPENVDNEYPNALMLRGFCTGVPSDTTASRYAPGASIIRTDAPVGSAQFYYNVGSATVPVWVGTIIANSSVGYNIVAVNTNGTALVNVFGATNPFAGTITGVFISSGDTTAGTVTMAQSLTSGGATTNIAVIPKSTTLGVMTGTSSLTIAFNYGGTITVTSSSAGNSVVYATYVSNSLI